MQARSPLKEARFVRKLAKRLGLKPEASAERVMREIEQLVSAARAGEPSSADQAGAPRLPTSTLEAMLAEVAAMLPLRREVGAIDATAPVVSLPAPLEAVRQATDRAHGE